MELSLPRLRSDYKLIYQRGPETALRLSALIELAKIEQSCRDYRFKSTRPLKVLALCQGLDISYRTLLRWKQYYLKGGLFKLTRRRPKGRPAGLLTSHQIDLIMDMRIKYRWGAEVIQAHLKFDYEIIISKSRIERYLTSSGLRDRYPCTTKKVKSRYRKMHTKKVRVDHPGQHTQLDTKHLPHLLQNNKKCYVFNFIDHASNWSFKQAYASLSPKSTIDFIKKLTRNCPFKILRLQTDNGTEFTYKFFARYADIKKEHPLELFCREHSIEHKLIPPGEKELQGLVERSHRQDDQELFIRINPLELDDFNKLLNEYAQHRNAHRRFKKLNWKTPDEWLAEYQMTKLKNTVLPTFTGQQELPTLVGSINSCKEKDQNDEDTDTKQAA